MKSIKDFTKEEIITIVTDLFKPVKISNIKINKKTDSVSCTIYTEWSFDGTTNTLIKDQLTLRNPFDFNSEAIDVEDYNMPIYDEDYLIFKKFCYAKGIVPTYLTKNNPYLKEN